MSSAIDDGLEWLATQYVLGELSSAEQHAFELRLESDLAACEAVAAASCQYATVCAAFEGATTVLRRPSEARATDRRWGVLAAAVVASACLFAVVILRPTSMGTDQTARELVAGWRAELQDAEMEIDETVADLPEADAQDIPDWLVASLTIDKHVTIDGEAEERKDN